MNTTGNHGNDAVILCPSCVSASLHSKRERHQLAKETWYESRTKCAEYFQRNLQPLADQATGTTVSAATTTNESTIRLYEQQYQQVRKELETLQKDSSRVTMETCALNLRIIERQESLSTLQNQYASQRRQILSQLQQSLCGNSCQSNIANADYGMDDAEHSNATSLTNARQYQTGAFIHSIETAQATVRTLRFHWSLQAFAMFRIQVDDEDMFHSIKNNEQGDGTTTSDKDKNANSGTRRVRHSRDSTKVVVSGIGKISGLPLPHAGMELYGVLPCEELQSALRLVAQLTHVLARCFQIRLPHPIVIVPPQRQQSPSSLSVDPINQQRFASSTSSTVNYQDGDIADLAEQSRNSITSAPTAGGINSITASLTSLSSILSGGGIAEARSAASGPSPLSSQHNSQQQLMMLSMDPKHVESRIRHATSAIIAEDQSRTTFYTLSTITPSTVETNNVAIEENPSSSNFVSNNSHNNTKPSTVSATGSTSQQQHKVHDEFAIALQLLQNDILMVCMNVGVPIDQLYPGEALLLNLYALQLYCSENA